jgi:3-isopropylmalate/(R)-2-methylmalate dehydratase small subunit
MNKNVTTIIDSTAVPLPIRNIDTDQIIPAQFLKSIDNQGFGDKLFFAWRKKANFILNNKKYSGKILVAGYNFGCGSSREHAVWALKDYGFDVIISSFFADIFKNNALNNRLLPVQVPEKILKKIFAIIEKNPKIKITIDIKNQKIIIPGKNVEESFFIDPYKKICLMNGYDDIDYLIGLKNKIIEFENNKKL